MLLGGGLSSVFSPLNEDGSGDRADDERSSVNADVDRRLSLTTQLLLQSSQQVQLIGIHCGCRHYYYRIFSPVIYCVQVLTL